MIFTFYLDCTRGRSEKFVVGHLLINLSMFGLAAIMARLGWLNKTSGGEDTHTRLLYGTSWITGVLQDSLVVFD